MKDYFRIIRRLSQRYYRVQKKRWRQLLRPKAEYTRPLFVLGVQRSGTNMLVDILDQSLDCTLYNEDHTAAFVDFRIRDFTVRQQLIQRSRSAWVIFKPIVDSHRAVELLDSHADSQGIWIYRHYQDVIHSAIAMWGDWHLRAVQRMATEPDWHYFYNEGLNSELRQVVEMHYNEQMSLPSASALIWYIRNRLYFDCRLHDRRQQVFLLRYETLVKQPQMVGQRIFDWLGVPFDAAYVKEVSQSSVSKISYPDIDPRLRALCDQLETDLDQWVS